MYNWDSRIYKALIAACAFVGDLSCISQKFVPWTYEWSAGSFIASCSCAELCCVVLGWVGLGWVGLGWVGLGWVGLSPFHLLALHRSKTDQNWA